MQVSAPDRLKDVAEAADAVTRFLDGVDGAAFRVSDLLRSAVQFKFVLIGEALNALSKEHPAVAKRVEGVGRTVAFRNVLVHGYRVVDYAEVFLIAKEDLPKLRANVAALLAELEQP